jgi:thiol-disulfide isomerase/thioredoxin
MVVLPGWFDACMTQADQAGDAMTMLPRMRLTPAPEFPPDLPWLNTPRPLRLRDLRGKVVLLDFWTYGCINCLHILPALHRLETTYARQLVVIGVHAAKYDNEAVLDNIRQAIHRYDITHAVVHDHAFQLWQAYRVSGWPTQILIDPTGHVLQGFMGEHHEDRIDRLIAATIAYHREQGTLRESAAVALPPPPAAATALRYPGKILVDTALSRLFIADTGHHRLVMTDMQGRVLGVIGQGHAGATDGSWPSARFRQPQGMAVQDGMLYVADTGNHLIRRVDLRRRLVDTLAGTGIRAREFNVPGYGRTVPLNSPWDLHGQAQALYIAMAGMHQIWRLNLTTAYAEPFAGSGREDRIDAMHMEAALGQPSGLSGDGRQLYVADTEVNAVRAVSLDPDGVTRTLVGGGLFTFGDRDASGREARLQHPLGVAYADGVVYVADTYNHKIKRLDPERGWLQTVAGTGQAGWRDGPAAQAQLYEPGGLSFGAGRVYVADTNNHRVRVLELATQRLSTLPLQGLEPPQRAIEMPALAAAPPSDPPDVMRLAEQVLAAGERTVLRLALHAPPGWKVNAQAPGMLMLHVQGEAVTLPEPHTKRTIRPMLPRLVVPLDVAAAGRTATLRVHLSFVLCRENNEGICVPRQVAWEVPVRSQAQVATAEVVLYDRMTSVRRTFGP